MSVSWVIVGVPGVAALVWLIMRNRLAATLAQSKELCQERDDARQTTAERERQLAEVRGDLQTQVARLETALQAEREGTEEKIRLLEETRLGLTETIKASCVDAFKEGNAQVVELATARMKTERAEGKREIERMVKPVADSLTAFRARLDEVEREQVKGRTELQEQLTALGQAQEELMAGTSALVGALRRPQVRGRWGEMTLKRVVETAGMLPHVDFTEQPTLDGEDGRLRPDLVVHIPGEKEVVVDSKVPLEAYLDACAATDEDERRRCLETHARQLRGHIKKLGSKGYWEQFTSMPDFVFLFVPNDQVLAAAAEVDPGLMGEIEKHRVFLATPMTLMVLLRVVAVAWQQEQVAESARVIWKLGRDLHRRLGKLGERLQVLGRRLKSTTTAFNAAVGTYEGRVLPSARRFRELGPVSPADTLPTPEQILETPRSLQAPEIVELPEDEDETGEEAEAGEAA